MIDTESKIYYRRNLPHYQPDNSVYFITFRLAGSLPLVAIEQLREENKLKKGTKYFNKFDKLLDSSQLGTLWLKNERISDLVADAIKYRDGKDYDPMFIV